VPEVKEERRFDRGMLELVGPIFRHPFLRSIIQMINNKRFITLSEAGALCAVSTGALELAVCSMQL